MTKKMSKNDISKNNRDETIGRALAATIAEQETIGSCLTDEDMAAMLDRKLSGPERDLLMKHLSSCETCLMIFTTSQRLMEKKTVSFQRIRFVLPSVGLAIAALLAIILRISVQGNAPDKPFKVAVKRPSATGTQRQVTPSPSVATHSSSDNVVSTVNLSLTAAETARLLIHESDVKVLQAAISSDKSQVYGFSGVVPRENRAFRLGVRSADLELLLQANDREEAVGKLKQMIDLLSATNKKSSDAARFEDIIRKLENGSPLKGYRNCTSSIEKTLTSKNELFLYRFGIWAEGGRLAATVGNKELIDKKSIRYVMAGVKDMQLPHGLLKALQEVEVIVENGTFAEKDFLVMKRAFEDVTAIF